MMACKLGLHEIDASLCAKNLARESQALFGRQLLSDLLPFELRVSPLSPSRIGTCMSSYCTVTAAIRARLVPTRPPISWTLFSIQPRTNIPQAGGVETRDLHRASG